MTTPESENHNIPYTPYVDCMCQKCYINIWGKETMQKYRLPLMHKVIAFDDNQFQAAVTDCFVYVYIFK